MALQSISNFCGSNIPGVYSIEYAPTAWIDTSFYQPQLDGHVWTGIIAFTTGNWLRMPVFYRPDQLWTQEQSDSQQGRSYQNTVRGTTPQLRVAVDAQLEQMPNYQYLLRLQDRNGNYWKLGTLETPFTFSCRSTAGNNSQRNQYEMNFQAELPNRVFGLEL